MKIALSIFQFICENSEWILSSGATIWEIFARIFDTEVDYSIINKIKKILDLVCPNYKEKQIGTKHD